jgi:hypothetical protein
MGVQVQLYSLFNLADGGGWSTPRPLYPREIPCTHCIGGWVSLRAGLDRCGKSRSQPGFDPRTAQPEANRYTNYPIPAHVMLNSTLY